MKGTAHPESSKPDGLRALTWYDGRPQVQGLGYEMDVRCVAVERLA